MAFVLLSLVNVVGWTAYLLYEPTPRSVWVRPRDMWTTGSRDLICDAPCGKQMGVDWHTTRQCGWDGRPERVFCDRGDPSTSIAWLRRLVGLRNERFVAYELRDDRVEREDGTWIEYAIADD